MRRIKMTNCNRYAIVDDEDYEKATSVTWAMTPQGYARRNGCVKIGKGKWKRPKIYLHRFLMDAPTGLQVDHKNHNRLDCRRSNMRIVTCAMNMLNLQIPKTHKTGIFGVHQTQSGKWMASISIKNKNTSLGTFSTKEDAILARQKAEKLRYDLCNMV